MGVATVLFLPLYLTPDLQGYYFTFASVLSIQIFFELGLNQILVQLVSHEVAHLNADANGRLTGDGAHLDRLGSLVKLTKLWYGSSALLFAVIGGTVGTCFFTLKGTEPPAAWLGPWVVLVAATAVNLWLSPRLVVLEGCGKVGQIARLRLYQSMMGAAGFWIALTFGASLWAVTVVPIVSGVCTGYWLKAYENELSGLSGRLIEPVNQISWKTQVFPLQWRISISFASGYIIFNLFTPMVFSYYGATEAGRLGMGLTMFSAISSIGMSWINAKAPNFTTYIARGERSKLNNLFDSLMKRSVIFVTVVSMSVVAGVWCLNDMGLPITQRIAPPSVLAMLAVVTVCNSMISAMATYMRAHREEPMLTLSAVVAILVAGAIYIGLMYSILAMVSLYMFITIFVSLPWALCLFYQYRYASPIYIKPR
jgi:hypothetical protein